jgi:membrane protein YfhO
VTSTLAAPAGAAPSRWRRRVAMPSLPREDATALAGLAAIVILLCWPVLVRGRVYWERDLHLYLYPHAEALLRVLAQGSLPLWNPYVGFGEPLLANPYMEIFYPGTWLQLLMQPWWWWTACVVTHLLLTAAGAYVLGRRLGTSRLGAFVTAATWLGSGPLISLVDLGHHLIGASWMPWVLVSSDSAASSGRARDVIVAILVLGLQILAGSPDMSALAVLLALAFALRHADWSTWRGANPRIAAAVASTIAGAAALSAAQWIPSLELSARASRLGLPDRIRTYWSTHPATLAQTVLPVTLHDLPLSDAVRAALYESREPFLISLYLGLAAAVLVVAAIGRRRSVRPLALLLGVIVLAALGRHTPVYAALTRVIAPLSLLRYPVKAMVPAALLWALLAGQGLDALRDPPHRNSRATFLVVALVLVAAAGSIAVAIALQPDRWAPLVLQRTALDPPFSAAVLPAARQIGVATGLALAVWAAAIAGKPSSPRWMATMAALAVAADLVIAHSTLNRTCAPELMAWRPPAVEAVRLPDHLRVYSYDYFPSTRGRASLAHPPYALAAEPSDPVVGAVALRGALFPLVLSQWGVESSYDLDQQGLFPKEMAMLARLLRQVEGEPAHLKLLQIGAVARVAAMHTAGFEDLTPVATMPTLFREPLRIYSVPGAVPRAYVVGGIVVADGDEAFATVQSAAFDPLREVVLPAGTATAPPAVSPGACRIVNWAADRIRVEASMDHPGILILVDTYDPGWRTRVDGQPATLLRANVAFRAVALPAGRHVVESVYRPPAVGVGLAVSALAAIALAGAWVRRGV